MFDLKKFLDKRERRVIFQNSLIKKYNLPLLTIRTNYPGENKCEFLANEIADITFFEMYQLFENEIIYSTSTITLEGKIYYIIINNDVKNIKRVTIDFEEKNPLGRVVDLDVYNTDGIAISRNEYGYSKRKCMLCNKPAFICGRNFTHTHEEIKFFIWNSFLNYKTYQLEKEKIASKLSDYGIKATIYEVASYPSFGLVSPLTKGAHEDMDFFTFLNSSFSLKNNLKKFVDIGYSFLPLDVIFSKIRKIGIECEKEMYSVTNNVNTHKGLIFLMGIVLAATGKALFEKQDFMSISENIKTMSKDIFDDFKLLEKKEQLSHGELLYLKYGFKGIRNEVYNGLDIIFNGSFDIFKSCFEKTKNINLSCVQTLIFLMANVDDSTIVYRHNIEKLKEVKNIMQTLYQNGGILEKENYEICLSLEKDFSQQRISPGGSADLLAITILLYFIAKDFEK